MEVEHLIRTMNKDMEKGYLSYSHVIRILAQFNHYPSEALGSNPLKLPTHRTLRLASTIQGLELENIYLLSHESEMATRLGAASQAAGIARHEERHIF